MLYKKKTFEKNAAHTAFKKLHTKIWVREITMTYGKSRCGLWTSDIPFSILFHDCFLRDKPLDGVHWTRTTSLIKHEGDVWKKQFDKF